MAAAFAAPRPGDGEHPGTLRRRGAGPPAGFGYRRTRIAETSIVEPSSPLLAEEQEHAVGRAGVVGELDLAGEVAEHAVAATGDERLADGLLHAVGVEADLDGALERVGLALERLRRGERVADLRAWSARSSRW